MVLGGLLSCVKEGNVVRGEVTPPAREGRVVGLCSPGTAKGLTLRSVREPGNLPACDLFFPLSAGEGLETTARIDIKSQGLPSWNALQGPVQRSLEYALNMPQDEPALARPGMSLTWGQVVRSLEEFLDLLPHLDQYPELLARRFVWYGMRRKPLMTGYYTAEIEASLDRRPGYDFPIYGVPEDLQYGMVRGRKRVYRVEGGRVKPYFERGDVDVRHVLAGKGLEIAWARDPLDVFYMQVEGCGPVAVARRHHPQRALRGQERPRLPQPGTDFVFQGTAAQGQALPAARKKIFCQASRADVQAYGRESQLCFLPA